MAKVTLKEVNGMGKAEFVGLLGGVFEHSPWVAERAWGRRPFENVDGLHGAMVEAMWGAKGAEQMGLIRAHPDLVGKLAREGRLTRESTAEQAAAGLTELSEEEVKKFEELNGAYREKFGFPFIICARENKKEAILAAFPKRLANGRDEEMAAAMTEIAKIAKLRLMDAVME